MKKSVASASGKLILFGEHAVVYGYPALVGAVDQRITVSMYEKSQALHDEIDAKGNNTTFIEAVLQLLRNKHGVKSAVSVDVVSDFSSALGIGSSAAVTVATIAAYCKLFAIKITHQQLFTTSLDVVKSVQKVGSGADCAASVYGGIIHFQKQKTERLSYKKLPLLIIYSGKKVSTTRYIQKVAKKYDEDKDAVNKLFKEMTTVTTGAKQALENNDVKKLGSLMTQNHALLQKLGVSTDHLDTLVAKTISAGAYGAKLSGAGGGDCIIALAPENKREAVKNSIEDAGGKIIDLAIDNDGVIMSTSNI